MNIEKMSLFFKAIRFPQLALIGILLNTVIFLLVVLPDQKNISNLQNRFAELRAEVRKQNVELRRQQIRLAKLQQAERDLKHMYKDVLSTRKTGVTDIRVELGELLASLQIEKEDFSYSYQNIEKFGVQQFRLSVPVRGNYRTIRQFINSIERSEHFLILERVELTSEQEATDRLNLDFRIATYLTQNGV